LKPENFPEKALIQISEQE